MNKIIFQLNPIVFLVLLFSCQSEKSSSISTNTIVEKTFDDFVIIQVSSRVDTSIKDIKLVLELYQNYINARPDSIYQNPYWNDKEKKKYHDFDFSRKSIYNGFTSTQLFHIYKPFVLSVEPKNQKFELRVMYSNNANVPPYVGSKIWCIHKLNAIQENGLWKLENLIVEKTKTWNSSKFGFIEFLYSDEIELNTFLAEKSLRFCQEIKNNYNPTYNNTFQFFMTSNVDEMGELENFDYYFTGITTGKSRENMIFSSKATPYYPHEFIHQLLPENKGRGHIIEEGLATFLGTREDKEEYHLLMHKLAKDYYEKETYTLANILDGNTKWNGYPIAYPAGALICEIIYDNKGKSGINDLIQGRTKGYFEIMELTKKILQLNESEIKKLIAQKIQTYI